MSRHRRLTALIASFLLLPSTVTGGWTECAMRSDGGMAAAVAATGEHAAHLAAAEHRAHLSDAAVSAAPDQNESPVGQPHAPAACLLVTGCVSVALAVPSDLIVTAAPRAARVGAERTLAPLSPALALEPPPPRA